MHFSKPDYRIAHLITSYNLNESSGFIDMLRRVVYISFAISISYAIFVAFSSARTALTKLCKHTLPIYLSQAIVLMHAPFLIKWKADEFSLLILIAFIFISFVIALLTGREMFDSLLRRVSGSILKNVKI